MLNLKYLSLINYSTFMEKVVGNMVITNEKNQQKHINIVMWFTYSTCTMYNVQ